MNKVLFVRRKGLGSGSCSGLANLLGKQVNVLINTNMGSEDFKGCDTVIRWGCTSKVYAKKTINSAKAISLGADKSAARFAMAEEQITPMTTFSLEGTQHALDMGAMAWPLIVRPRTHSQGKRMFLCNNYNDLVVAVASCGEGYYISQYIPKAREFRVFVVGGRAVSVIQKIPEDVTALAWNQAQGSDLTNVKWDSWPLMAVRKAIRAAAIVGLDFCGVDVIESTQGQYFVLEVNSAPSVPAIQAGENKGQPSYNQKCMSKGLAYIIENGKQPLPLGGLDSYRGYIHPAISNKAEVFLPCAV